jgi:hypothetical protein
MIMNGTGVRQKSSRKCLTIQRHQRIEHPLRHTEGSLFGVTPHFSDDGFPMNITLIIYAGNGWSPDDPRDANGRLKPISNQQIIIENDQGDWLYTANKAGTEIEDLLKELGADLTRVT